MLPSGAESIHPQAVDIWKKILMIGDYTRYTDNGERELTEYTCELQHREIEYNWHLDNESQRDVSSYVVKGRFVPNRLTVDSNSNRRLDILRCPIRNAKDIYESLNELIRKNELVHAVNDVIIAMTCIYLMPMFYV